MINRPLYSDSLRRYHITTRKKNHMEFMIHHQYIECIYFSQYAIVLALLDSFLHFRDKFDNNKWSFYVLKLIKFIIALLFLQILILIPWDIGAVLVELLLT